MNKDPRTIESLNGIEIITGQPAPQSSAHRGQFETHQQEKPMLDGEDKAGPPADKKRPKVWLRIVLAALALGAVVAAGLYYLQFIDPFETTDNASIEGHVTQIAPQVSGRVVRLLVQDNQEVRQGDVLLEIDARDYEARLAQARAGLAAARSQLAQANAQLAVDEAKAGEEKAGATAAEAEASRAQADLKRYQGVESRAVSRSQLDLVETQARSAAAQVEVARQKVLAAEAQVGLCKASIQTASDEVRQSEAATLQAELNVSYTKVTAPEDGRVTRRTVEQGAFVQPGQALMAVVSRPFWIVANYKETQLGRMRVGQPVKIKVDAYPGRNFNGHIDSIQSGAGARFSMFPPENATGNFIKVVQRVPVKILFDAIPDPQLTLGPGMSVEPSARVKQGIFAYGGQ
jgi:membrane fusion protein (multidrug efflux system)